MRALLTRLSTDETGSSSMEYALIASLVSIAGIAGYVTFSNSANTVWTYAANAITAALQ